MVDLTKNFVLDENGLSLDDKQQLLAGDDTPIFAAQENCIYYKTSGEVYKYLSGQWVVVNEQVNTTQIKTSDYTLTQNDSIILADTTNNNIILSLPTSIKFGKEFTFKKSVDKNTLYINGGLFTFDGQNTIKIKVKNTSITVKLIDELNKKFIII
ncbi:MAG: hypothetical protein QG564_1825 [Campylobacterota bacterium]|nr:hypothetical protein [Campylobacterota bacterium]